MSVDLFLKKVPTVIKDLISREAGSNRRSINQEAIALLEEALLMRVELAVTRPPSPAKVLETYASTRAAASTSGPDSGPVPLGPNADSGFGNPMAPRVAKH